MNNFRLTHNLSFDPNFICYSYTICHCLYYNNPRKLTMKLHSLFTVRCSHTPASHPVTHIFCAHPSFIYRFFFRFYFVFRYLFSPYFLLPENYRYVAEALSLSLGFLGPKRKTIISTFRNSKCISHKLPNQRNFPEKEPIR